MEILLRIEDLKFSYKRETVLDGVSLQVEAGQLCALLGENGSGKSTLLKLIGGMEKQQDGQIFIEENHVWDFSAKQRAKLAAYLPQRFGVYFDTGVLDMVLMGVNPELSFGQTPSERHIRKARAALEYLHLSYLGEANYMYLSEGEKQMVMIARAMVQGAPLLLFDEPDSALDVNNRYHLMQMLRKLADEENLGALLVLHDPQLTLSYGDKVYLLKAGKICAEMKMTEVSAEEMEDNLRQVFPGVKVYSRGKELYIGYRQ